MIGNNNNKIINNKISNNKSLINILSLIYKKEVIIKPILVNNINNDDELYLNAYRQLKYNDNINNTKILNNKKLKSSFNNNNLILFNPSKIDDQYINNISLYYNNIYNNITNIKDIKDINIINILNNTNINIMDKTMTNKYIIGIINIIKGKGSNISAIGRSEYKKDVKGSFINNSSKSHIKAIYNQNNKVYNTSTKLKNKNIINNINNNTTINNNSIIFTFGIEGLKRRTAYA